MIEYSLSSQWQFTGVLTVVHHRTCRITAHRFPLVHVDIYVPPTATYLQYRVIGLTPMVVGLSQSLAQQSGTVSRISSGTRQSALSLSDICWRCTCLCDTSACSSLEVDNFMRYINLLTYLQLSSSWQVFTCHSRMVVHPSVIAQSLVSLLANWQHYNCNWVINITRHQLTKSSLRVSRS